MNQRSFPSSPTQSLSAKRRNRRALPLGLWLLCILCGCTLVHCKQMAPDDRRRRIPVGTAHTTTPQKQRSTARMVLSTLAIARSRHKRATILQQLGKTNKALKELDAILALRFPTRYRPGEEMRLDTWGRKATILLETKQTKQAKVVIDHAIKRGTWLKHSFYFAHLHYVKGRTLAALKQPKQALRSFQTAIRINQQVIQQAKRILQPSTIPSHRRQP